MRSLKGGILRQEIYALDGSEKQPHPYSVSERNYEIRLEQRLGTNRHAVFFTHDRETIDCHYERNPADPRITHAMTLEVDEFGNGLKSVAIAYPRRTPAYPEQGKTLITYTENQVTNKPNEVNWYRIGVPIETRTYELTGYTPTDNRFQRFDFVQSGSSNSNAVVLIFDSEINYEAQPTSGKQRRLIERVRSLYRPNNQANTVDPTCLPLGEIESLALPCESFKLAFTPGLLTQVYSSKIAASDLSALLSSEGNYVNQDGVWWIPSGRQAFDANNFYLPTQTKDPFGNLYTSTYDTYCLLVVQTIDPLNNMVQIRNNYRTMQPEQITDPNGNRSQARFDALGMVVGTAVMGKASENLGDSFATFNPDLSDSEIKAFFDADDPRSLAIQHLGTATTRIIYDLDHIPVCAAAIARKKHVSDLAGQSLSLDDVQVGFVYSDGFGREAQTKVQAEPGPQDPNVSDSPMLDPRWVGTGAKVYNNKGKPVRQYEPFFSPTHHFGIEQWGVSSTLFYDPVERVVATLHPNHTYEKVVFDPWRQESWDVNDTALIADPKADPDVGDFFHRIAEAEYLPTWYAQRQGGALGADEQTAAAKTAIHAGTPAIAHADSLGRTFLTIAHNKFKRSDTPLTDPPTEEFYATRVVFDIEGNQREVIDAQDRIVMRYDYDLLGHRIHQASMEAGERWMLNDVAGKPIRAWNSRGHTFRTEYDPLHRPLRSFVLGTDSATPNQELLTDRSVYGEQHPEAVQRNLRGKLYLHLDQAGVVSSERYDFKGNGLEGARRLAREYKQTVDWSSVDAVLPTNATTAFNPAALEAALVSRLEADLFTSRTSYDALNRPVTLQTPDNSVIHPTYNAANLLERVEANLRGAAVATPFVTNIDYDAKGQRTLIEHGNGVRTIYEYDRLTFRLMQLQTQRGAEFLQNLGYTYDPVGNITHIRDDAQQTIYFRNQRVEPSADYTYDAIYQLIEATGREHLGQIGDVPNAPTPTSYNDVPRVGLPHPGDGNAMGRYLERYIYDAVGNFLEMQHRSSDPSNPGWNRAYAYNEPSQLEPGKQSNRLTSTTVGGTTETYSTGGDGYDLHGNMLHMPQLQVMQWDYRDELQMTQRQRVNDQDADGLASQGERTYYVYDAAGQRVRKVTEWANNGGLKDERIYLGGFEVYRKHSGTHAGLVRETLHIMDDKQRIALVETRNEVDDGTAKQLIRYQFGNHLGSASLELDDQAQIISYEEYFPYGSTSYQAGRSVAEVSLKRYRYTGMERDEESGFNYHGARYYAAWLGRWTSSDPASAIDGCNLYQYCRNNPLSLIDPNGTAPSSSDSGPTCNGTEDTESLDNTTCDGSVPYSDYTVNEPLAEDPAKKKISQQPVSIPPPLLPRCFLSGDQPSSLSWNQLSSLFGPNATQTSTLEAPPGDQPSSLSWDQLSSLFGPNATQTSTLEAPLIVPSSRNPVYPSNPQTSADDVLGVSFSDGEHMVAHGGLVYYDGTNFAHKMYSGDIAGGVFDTTDVNGRYTDTRVGFRADINSYYWRFGKEYGTNFSNYSPRAAADVSIGTDGISVGAYAALMGVDLTVGDLNSETTDTRLHGGVSIGFSLGGRIHYADKDHDGLRELGAGVDLGFFSFDVQSEVLGAKEEEAEDLFRRISVGVTNLYGGR